MLARAVRNSKELNAYYYPNLWASSYKSVFCQLKVAFVSSVIVFKTSYNLQVQVLRNVNIKGSTYACMLDLKINDL